MTNSIQFSGGNNIAIKTPPHEFDQVIRFYREILRLPQIEADDRSVAFEFGPLQLWVDKVDGISQAEVWLEIKTDHILEAKDYLDRNQVIERDEIETLPEEFKGFWISSPNNIIHLVSPADDDT